MLIAAVASVFLVIGGPGVAAATASPGGSAHDHASADIGVAPLLDPGARNRCIAAVAGSPAPLLVAAGASFSAGVGSGSPATSFAADLARRLGWRAVIVGVPGIGYVHHGIDGAGPLLRVLRTLGVARLSPRLLLVQAGHDDRRVGAAREALAVRALYRWARKTLPSTAIASVTVFWRGSTPSAALRTTDRTIVAAIHATDPTATVLDPWSLHWSFAHRGNGLHPSRGGARRLAALIAGGLERSGVTPATGTDAPICALTAPFSGRVRLPAGPTAAR